VKKSQADDGLRVVLNEGGPTLSGTAARTVRIQVLSHRTRRDLDAELELQFIGNSLFAPGWILASHLAN
jgi:hypothetical protein